MDVDLYSRLQVCVIVDIVYTVYTLYAIYYTQGNNSTAIHKKWLLEVFITKPIILSHILKISRHNVFICNCFPKPHLTLLKIG